ncbi:phosphate:acyl-[acyl carrier protein] acyltransferase [Pseudarcicella hirudinis]|uniref:Phosphate acyltransferase n=1 Tax=Pseudarcicella hirudinis TaxID=1079859 RepID=A0A1I5UG24_9BACT|nr:phosphate acyltransferase PlsX [Pseudarcicella hirudinis]SFP94139.1 phosphate:acyl-[acyl carrier protein] acyltransferase [Pseudarcicella hirudinis]
MKIAVDAMGGDFAPEAIVDGVIQASAEMPSDVTIVLIGQQSVINAILEKHNFKGANIEIIHADDVIEMGEHPTKALSQKPNSSIGVGFKLLKTGEVDVFASAGNTGAMMVGALFSVKAIEGVFRPAIAGFAPQTNGKYAVMLDIGANADVKPEMLAQFAELGSIYCRATTGEESPRVALMNIGEEEKKGSLIIQAAHQLMKENKKINFIGNIEGKDFFKGKADVIVTDGFTGNILLKMGESLYGIMAERGVRDSFLDGTNYEAVGGSPIIGVNGNVIIAHGASSPTAIKNMVHLCKKQVESKVYQKIKEALA